MIISLRDPQRPVLQPFAVHKQLSDFGISDRDTCQDSQLSYPGPEVRPLTLAAYGPPQAVRQLTIALAADWQLSASGRTPAANRARDASGMEMVRAGAAQPALTEPLSARRELAQDHPSHSVVLERAGRHAGPTLPARNMHTLRGQMSAAQWSLITVPKLYIAPIWTSSSISAPAGPVSSAGGSLR